MKSWRVAVLLTILAMGLAGGLGWWWVAGDTIMVKSGNTEVVFRNSKRIGKAVLNGKIIKQVLSEINLNIQKKNVVFDFKKYKDQDFANSLVLMPGSIISVGTMMCSKPIVNKDGSYKVIMYTSADVFADKYGENTAFERENNMLLLCVIRGLAINQADDLTKKMVIEQKLKVVDHLIYDKN